MILHTAFTIMTGNGMEVKEKATCKTESGCDKKPVPAGKDQRSITHTEEQILEHLEPALIHTVEIDIHGNWGT